MSHPTVQAGEEQVQQAIANRLPAEQLAKAWTAGIIGETSSTMARSPKLWTAAFTALGWDAAYLPFDVANAGKLAELVAALRGWDRFLGGNVTVPYKVSIVPLLDAVDPLAARIGAVNTIVRSAEGRLTGYNTDGIGGVRSLTEPVLPGTAAPLQRLDSLRVVLLGTGGAAKALACTLASSPIGRLTVVGRSPEAASALARQAGQGSAVPVDWAGEADLPSLVKDAGLIINATIKGQAGARRVGAGWTCFEPYSALAPAHPPAVAEEPSAGFWPAYFQQAAGDIAANQAASWPLCGRLKPGTVCYDIIFSPAESVFLQHARWSGHRTLNGRPMNLAQAVEGFVSYVGRPRFDAEGRAPAEARAAVAKAMAAA